VTKLLSAARFVTAALALVDDIAAMDIVGIMSAVVAQRYRVSSSGRDHLDAAGAPAASLTDGGWSAAFVHHVGYCSQFDEREGRSVWPLPITASCTELASFAAQNFVLAGDAPQPGDVYLLWSPRKQQFVRAGIVLRYVRPSVYPSGRTGYECLTIDGDTTWNGSLRGSYTAVVRRALSPDAGDRLIRWPLLALTSCEQAWSAEAPLRRAA
jgi:hypothetical protein